MSVNKDIKSTFKHAIVYSGSSILAKSIGFIMLPIYAHKLKGEGYGMIGIIDVMLSVMTVLIGYGIQAAMNRLYFEKKKLKEQNTLISTSIFVMLSMVLTFSSPALFLNKQISSLLFGADGFGIYIVIAVLTFIAEITGKNAERYILIKKKSIFYSCLSLIKLIIGLSLNIYLIVYLNLGVLGYLYSGLITGIFFTLIVHTYTLYNVGFSIKIDDAKSILEFSLPLIPGYLAMFVRTNTDRILLRSLFGLTMLGAYEMLFKFATIIGMIVVEPFSKIWSVKRFEIADEDGGPILIAKMFTHISIILLFFGLILSLEIPIILKVLTPKEFWLSGSIASLAVLSRIFLASYYHFFFGIVYSKQTYKLSVIQWVSVVLNLLFVFILVKPFGILGAVLASCLTNLSQCLIAYHLATPLYRIPFEWRKLAISFLICAVLFVMLNSISLESFYVSSKSILEIINNKIEMIFYYLNFDKIKDGKLIIYIKNNLINIIEGGVKATFAILYIPILIVIGVIPRKIFINIVKYRTLKPLLNQ